MSIPLFKNDKIYISSSLKKLLNKKVNFFFQNKFKNTQKLKFTIFSNDELAQIKLPLLKKIKIIIIALSLLFLYFTKMFICVSESKKIKKNKIVLIFSLTKNQIFKDNSLYNLHNFLVSKKFDMTEKSEILIECREVLRTKKYSNLIVTLDIPLKIFTIKFSLKQKWNLILIFSQKLLTLIKSFNNSQYMYLIFKEYIFDESVYLLTLNEDQVDIVVTTPGAIQYQPIIFEIPEFTGERVMLWYSSNTVPLRYKSTKASIVGKNSEIFLKHMAIDTHWVWTSEHKKFLMKVTNSTILVKGSMQFYNCPKKLDFNKKYDVIIFDVTPASSNSIYKDTMYTFPIAKEFIEDIIESVKLVSQKLDRDISIYIKHKRPFSRVNSSRYITYINKLVKNRQLFVLPMGVDLYETIAASKIIIGFPFTSPVIIGQELKVPSVHYSSSNILVKYNKTNIIQNKIELKKFLEKNLNE